MIPFALWLLLSAFTVQGKVPAAKPSVTIVISTATPKVTMGSAPELTIKFGNNTNRVFNASGSWSDATGVDSNWQFDVRDSTGKSVPRRVYSPLAMGFGKAVFRDVSPGDSFTDHVDLGRLYVFRKPGNYKVQVSREIPKEFGGGSEKSNIITITVTK